MPDHQQSIFVPIFENNKKKNPMTFNIYLSTYFDSDRIDHLATKNNKNFIEVAFRESIC